MASNMEIMTLNNNNTSTNNTSNSGTENSTDTKTNNESYTNVQSKFAVHLRNDKRKKFFTRATSAKITVKEFFDFIKTAYQVNESLEHLISDTIHNGNGDMNGNSNGNNINWTKLANNQLINQLITIEQQQQLKLQDLNKKENECQTTALTTNEAQNNSNKLKLKQSQLSLVKATESTSTVASTTMTTVTTSQTITTTEVKQSSINMLHDMMDEIICEARTESPARNRSFKTTHSSRTHSSHTPDYYHPHFVKLSSTITNDDIKRIIRNIRNSII